MKIKHYIDIIIVLTQKELKVRYKNSFLGYLWSIAHPLAFGFVFFVAFKVVMRVEIEDYALFLVAGLFPWQWFSNSVNASSLLFLANASIIKKIKFPKNLIPFTQVLQEMIHFILSIPVIVLFLILYQKSPSFSWIYGIPLLLIVQFVMSYGICLILASANLFFRDLERLSTIFTTLLFYFTPIIYPENMVPAKYSFLIHINPLSSLMLSWRNLFLTGTLEVSYLAMSVAYAIFFFGLGHWTYSKLSWKFAEVL
jgi:lipopolysaccharide transport system permease protein